MICNTFWTNAYLILFIAWEKNKLHLFLKKKKEKKTKIFGPTQIRTEIKRSRVSYTNPYTMGPSQLSFFSLFLVFLLSFLFFPLFFFSIFPHCFQTHSSSFSTHQHHCSLLGLWIHCDHSLHDQTNSLWMSPHHKHKEHFLKVHCFGHDSQERKTHGVTWHSVVDDQAWVRWLLCNDIIPKAIPLSERLVQCPHLAAHINTKKLIELARTHRLWYTQDCSSHMRDRCMGWHWQLLMTTPWHSLPHHPSIKPTLFHSLSTLSQHTLCTMP